MIRNLLIVSFYIPLFSLAQQKNMTYDQTQDINFAEQYKNNTVIDSYKTEDGIIINIGDTLTIGNAVIKRKKYLFNDFFSHIVIGNIKGKNKKEFRPLPHNYSGSKVIVESLYVRHEGLNGYKLWPNRKRMPLYVSVFVRNPRANGLAKIFLYSRKTILDIEKALLSREIVN